MAAAVAAQDAAAPLPAVLRLLRRAVGADPLTGDALEHYVDAVGQREVGRRLAVLRRRSGPTPPWHVVHDLDLGDQPVDHVLVGPGGVCAVTTLHLPGSRVRAVRSGLLVDGQRAEHLQRAQQRARALQQLLARATGADVPVRAVVAVLGAERLALPLRTGDVAVLRAPVLVRWLRRQPHVLDATTAARLAAAVRDLDPGDGGAETAAFSVLHERVRAADRLRRAWFVAVAVAGSTGVTTLLAAVSP
ncbi:NERD domain-containing protein [Streptomyces sp. NP160]|uniref:nuclease-related domain-containing protein n=1 Tax=Streptomyces sp. NP160 TaxID=2586637 RepID=UPI0011183041|nr:nuclease-related domain-containing protein [Streptomyces sp. NP160]TNM69692.1 NERD domain-containing protein [Streptomyces sp. NP160]